MGSQTCKGNGVTEMRQVENGKTVVLRHKFGAKDAEIFFFDENGKEIASVEIPAPGCFNMESNGNGRMKICGKTYDIETGKRVTTAKDVCFGIVKWFFLIWFTIAGITAFTRLVGKVISQ